MFSIVVAEIDLLMIDETKPEQEIVFGLVGTKLDQRFDHGFTHFFVWEKGALGWSHIHLTKFEGIRQGRHEFL